MTDKSTKILLAVIAAGLWANFSLNLLKPAVAQQGYNHQLANIESKLESIDSMISSITRGVCVNSKLC